MEESKYMRLRPHFSIVSALYSSHMFSRLHAIASAELDDMIRVGSPAAPGARGSNSTRSVRYRVRSELVSPPVKPRK
jgi:hypothetical protein